MDHDPEFNNEGKFKAYYDDNGISHNFSTPRTPQSNGVVERLWYPKVTRVETIVYADSDHTEDYVDRKSTSEMRQALVDYDIKLDEIPILCNNKGAIDLSKNPIQHAQTKHIEIRHHFLRDNVKKVNFSIEKVSSEDNIADILTKPLKREPFNLL
ncbi:copia protein [Tanacetum coccineum]